MKNFYVLLILSSFVALLHPSFAHAEPSGTCSDVFEPVPMESNFLDSRSILKQMDQLEKQIINQILAMSFTELSATANESIQILLQTQGYLPGFSPDTTPHSVQEFIEDFHNSQNFSFSKNKAPLIEIIRRNLAAVDEIYFYLKTLTDPWDQNESILVQEWENQIWHNHVFRALEIALQNSQKPFF